MTIVAGFVCSDGIALCADSEESTDYTRNPVQKLQIEEKGKPIALAGSGAGDLVDALGEKILRSVTGSLGKTSVEIQADIEAVLADFYDRQIVNHPLPPESRATSFLVAFKPDGEGPALLRTSGTTTSWVRTYGVIGSGAILNYVVGNVFIPGMTLKAGRVLALLLLSIAKKYVQGCSGFTQLLTIGTDGAVNVENPLQSATRESYLSNFHDVSMRLTFLFVDLETSDKQLDEAVELFMKWVKLGRAKLKQEEETFLAIYESVIKNPPTRKQSP